MTPFSFQPACLPITQNELPHQDASQAMKLLRGTLSRFVTWPRLPQRSIREHSYVQSAIGFPGLVIDEATGRVYVDQELAEQHIDQLGLAYLQKQEGYGSLKTDDAAGLHELLRTPEQLLQGRIIASQILGPISLGLHLTDQRNRPLVYNPMLLDALAQHLALRIAWLTRRLKELFPTTDSIIWLDEPLLPALNSPFCPITWDYGADLLELVFADASACHGIILNDFGARQRDHNLSSIWIPLLETSVDCILVDVYRYSSILLAAGEKLAEFLKRSGTVAWGLIPADEEMLTLETPATLTSRFEHMLDQLAEAGLSREQVVRSAFISTSGNLGLISVEAAEHALQLCSDVSAHLRATYGLTDTDQPGKRTPDKKPPIELSRVNRQEEL